LVRRKKHHGKNKTNKSIYRPLSIEKIERRFDGQVEEKQFLAEAFLLGRNKYGNADTIPMMVVRYFDFVNPKNPSTGPHVFSCET